ncbi:hypothetical protein BJY04DRAFT_189941 [Aspergillus karnatakaensis]|uniref:uncharacterized protein n=1 Tax=Aspergillus karnatakaensis TaxID=1810916 RepID=UPI003CCDBC87
MRSNTLLFGLSLLSTAMAASEVVTMYIPDNADGQALAGKVLGSNSDTTSYAITCADSVKTSCEVPEGATIIQAPSAATVIAAVEEHTGTVECTYSGKTATCSMAIDGEWLATDTEAVASYEVTITATGGAESTSKPVIGSASVSATPTPMTLLSSASGCEEEVEETETAAASTTRNNEAAGAQETEDPDNGAMGLSVSLGGLVAVMGAAVALL